MPKRRAGDISEDEGASSKPTTTKKRLTREEKAALRARAAQAMQPGAAGSGSPPPAAATAPTPAKKRRKLATTTPAAAAPAPAPAPTPAPTPTTNKKMSKREAQKLARERARIAMMQDSSAPTASAATSSTAAAPSPAPAPVPVPAPATTTTTAAPAPAPAAVPASTTTTATAATAPAPAASVPASTAPTAAKAPAQAPASSTSSTSSRRSTTGGISLASRTTTTTGTAAGAATTIPNPPATFPTPPAAAIPTPAAAATTTTTAASLFSVGGTTATGQQTMEASSFTQHVLQQPPAAAPPAAATATTGNPTLFAPTIVVPPPATAGGQPTPAQPTPFVPAAGAGAAAMAPPAPVVVAPAGGAVNNARGGFQGFGNDDYDDGNNETTTTKRLLQVALVSLVLLCVHLVYTDAIKYNPKSGMLMIVGSTRIKYKRKNTAYTAIETESPIDLAEVVAAAGSKTICYQDSSAEVLEMVDDDLLESVVAPTDCSTIATPPCPSNAICYRGIWLDCQAPVWESLVEQDEDKAAAASTAKSSPPTPPLCVLSRAVNTTYAEIVELLEHWSIHEMCSYNPIDGEGGMTPITFYAQDKTDPVGAIVLAEGAWEQQQASINKRIPLYSWSSIFKGGPDSLDPSYWDWDLLRLVNLAHADSDQQQQPRLVLDDEFHITTTESVGLSPTQFQLVEKTKLPSQCKLTRRLFGFVDTIGSVTMDLGWGLFHYGWILLQVLAQTLWYFTNQYPILMIPLLIFVALYGWYRHYKWTQACNLKLVKKAKKATIKHLKETRRGNREVGQNLRKGEVVAIHVRDSICEELYKFPTQSQHEHFSKEIWPQIIFWARHDNRVSKESRLVGSSKREIWAWIASTEAQDDDED